MQRPSVLLADSLSNFQPICFIMASPNQSGRHIDFLKLFIRNLRASECFHQPLQGVTPRFIAGTIKIVRNKRIPFITYRISYIIYIVHAVRKETIKVLLDWPEHEAE